MRQSVANMDNKGLTLLEILISLMILSLISAGMVGIFISGNQYVLHSRSKGLALEAMRFYADALQSSVRQDTWGTSNNNLTPGNSSTFIMVDNINYTVMRSVTNLTGVTLRKAYITLTWNETQ